MGKVLIRCVGEPGQQKKEEISFKVRTYTPAHEAQQNALTGVFSAEFEPVTALGGQRWLYLPLIRK